MSQASYQDQVLHPVKDYKIQDLDLVTSVQKMMSVKEKIDSMDCRLAPDFKEMFEKVYDVMSVKEEIARMEYLCSEASLALLPDYNCRISVLHQLQSSDNKIFGQSL